MTETSSAKFIVQHPFDAESDGDSILRTCDGVEFKVSKAVLSFASSIFRDMFALPPVASEGKDQTEIPVVPIEEDAPTLQALLQMIYPIDPPHIASFPMVQKLVVACDRYFISTRKLQLHLRDVLNDDQFFKEDPLACYAFFWKLGWEEEAIKASRYTHTLELTENSTAKQLINQSGDIEALLQLLRLRDSREQALDDLLSVVKSCNYYACNLSHGVLYVKLNDYFQRKVGLKQSLKEAYPNAQDVENFLGFQIVQSSPSCGSCTEGRTAHLHSLRAKVTTALEAYPQAISGLPSRE